MRGIVFISAHWQADSAEVEGKPGAVLINESHSLLYDYYNFPPEYYKLTMETNKDTDWLAQLLRQTLESQGSKSRHVGTTQRGLDHGVFIPLLASFGKDAASNGLPPLVQLSLPPDSGNPKMDGLRALQLGAALQQLRRQGIAVVGGGQPVHNLRELFANRGRPDFLTLDPPVWATEFAKAASQAVHDASAIASKSVSNGTESTNQSEIPEAWGPVLSLFDHQHYLRSHPTSEHLLPLLVCIGAAGSSRGTEDFQAVQSGLGWGMYSWK